MASEGWRGWRLGVKIFWIGFAVAVVITGIVLVVRHGG